MSHSRADDALALALARGLTVTDAAREAGISRATATRRLADAEFVNRAREARQDLFDRATGQLADTLTEAVTALRELLHSPSESVRLRAAATLLDDAVRYHDGWDLACRVQNIETYIDWSINDKNQRASA